MDVSVVGVPTVPTYDEPSVQLRGVQAEIQVAAEARHIARADGDWGYFNSISTRIDSLALQRSQLKNIEQVATGAPRGQGDCKYFEDIKTMPEQQAWKQFKPCRRAQENGEHRNTPSRCRRQADAEYAGSGVTRTGSGSAGQSF